MSQATHANELNHAAGISRDFCLASELADYEAEQEAEDERWERDGSREMHETLFGGWEV
jgi:hypothetical protein